MSSTRLFRLAATLIAAAFMLTACGGSGGGGGSANKGTITVGGFNFAEGSNLAYLYGDALKKKGWTVKYRTKLGAREVVGPALQRGDIDLYIGYAATDLEYWDNKASLAGPDAQKNVDQLNSQVSSKGLKALNPAAAQDQNAFVLSASSAKKFNNPTKISDLKAFNGQIVLGGPPECPTRPFCEAGLKSKYGLTFKDFKPLDADGPLTRAALDKGDIDMGLVFSSDSDIKAKGYVELQDDMKLQNADNVTPVVRTATVNSDAQSVLNDISSKLTTDALIQLNADSDASKDPQSAADSWLTKNGY